MTTQPLARPALRYHGGKWVLAPWIIEHLPAGHECYVEPFGGAASVLLRKRPSPIEVYNDLDGEVVNFFRVLRDRTEELVRAVALTPYAREEQQEAYQVEGIDDLERARRFFVLAWQSRGANRGNWRTGWRYMRTLTLRGQTPTDDWRDAERLFEVAARWREVCIEHDDAVAVIERFDAPGTLFYCDPPYVRSSRSMRWGENAYRHEMTDDDHRRLAESLTTAAGMVVISGYRSALYDELYAGWSRVERTTNTDGKAGHPGRAVECLWLNAAASDAGHQRSMFHGEEVASLGG